MQYRATLWGAHPLSKLRIDGQTIQYCDSRHVLVVEDRVVALSQREYTLTMALLYARSQWEAAGKATVFYVPLQALAAVIAADRHRQYVRYLGQASLKLEAVQIRIVWIPGVGYTLLLPQDAGEAAEGHGEPERSARDETKRPYQEARGPR